MKLIKAKFENFRLLRDLEINFSLDKEKRLTVIRAENETGKTTMLNALQWALYGENALPNSGVDYRLHPIDWDQKNGNNVDISVSIDFEHTTLARTSSGYAENLEKYRIIRNTTENVDGIKWERGPSTVNLYVLSDNGAELIEHPDSFIDDLCPSVLREIFFTDGDRALNFIEEASISTKRERVHRAIKSLLGLDVINSALLHMNQVEREVNKKAKEIGSASSRSKAEELLKIDIEIEKLQAGLTDAKEQFRNFDSRFHGIDKKISEALQKGNREEMKKELESLKGKIKNIDALQEDAQKEHCNLFKSQVLSKDLLRPILDNVKDKLQSLRDRGKIPNTTIPVLEDRLDQDICFCGETIDPKDKKGLIRHNKIKKLIEDSRKADEIQGIVTNLYFTSNELLTESIEDENDWITSYSRIFNNRDKLRELRKIEGTKLKGLEAEIKKVPDTDLQGLIGQKKEFLEQRDRFSTRITELSSKIGNLDRTKDVLTSELSKLLGEEKKGIRILADLDVVKDVKHILTSSYDYLTDQELQKVSDLMNKIFLNMIGADPDQQAIIKKTLISNEFDIIVYGPSDRTLNPDRDLNGASRRALTLAFILALTKVSEFEAPNIIDTPLGMMSGYVKQSVLKTAIKESSQLILFLTRSEITGCEAIINHKAGSFVTLTNTAHYPKMLKNDPETSEQKVISCTCTQKEECKICERHWDSESE